MTQPIFVIGIVAFFKRFQIYSQNNVHLNLGLTNLRGTKILFFITGVSLPQGHIIMKLTIEGLRIKFFTTRILLLKGSLFRGFNVVLLLCNYIFKRIFMNSYGLFIMLGEN
jgi:hypothetical protein